MLKPLNEVKHGGGQKMLPGDMTYKSFRSWLDDYATTVNDRYATAAELPKKHAGPVMFGTEIWLKLSWKPADFAGTPSVVTRSESPAAMPNATRIWPSSDLPVQ